LRKLDHLAVLIGKLDIRKSPSDALIHVINPFLSLKDYDSPPKITGEIAILMDIASPFRRIPLTVG